MNLKGSNVTCQWVPTQPSDERSKRHRKATETQILSNIEVYKLEGHEGFFYEVQDIYSKYLRRPQELKNICYAQLRSLSSNENDDELEDKEFSETYDKDSMKDDDFMKFNYIMTFDLTEMGLNSLPRKIKLKDAYPGEPKFMQKRQFPAALRYINQMN